jgi:hypothetical protein
MTSPRVIRASRSFLQPFNKLYIFFLIPRKSPFNALGFGCIGWELAGKVGYCATGSSTGWIVSIVLYRPFTMAFYSWSTGLETVWEASIME